MKEGEKTFVIVREGPRILIYEITTERRESSLSSIEGWRCLFIAFDLESQYNLILSHRVTVPFLSISQSVTIRQSHRYWDP